MMGTVTVTVTVTVTWAVTVTMTVTLSLILALTPALTLALTLLGREAAGRDLHATCDQALTLIITLTLTQP